MRRTNHQFQLAARPVGSVKTSDWNKTSESVRKLEEGEFLVQNMYLSLDPAMRGWINESKASYIPPVGLGEVMRCPPPGTPRHLAVPPPPPAPAQRGPRYPTR